MIKTTFALVLSSAFLLLAACAPEGASTPPTATPLASTDTPTAVVAPTTAPLGTPAAGICGDAQAPAYLTDTVLARDVKGDTFTPVDVTQEFATNQGTFHAVVTLKNAPASSRLRAVWYLVKAEGYKDDSKIDESTLSVDQGGSRNVDFTLKSPTGTWPAGSFCVEIYANGTLAVSRHFTVAGGNTPTPGANPVVQVVLAQDTKPETFEPVNPTTTFKKGDPFIHAALQLKDAPANTSLRARWYPPNQDPLDFNLTTDGTRWVDFRLTPTPTGFPSGDYKVEIYLNDQLVETKTFTVQ